MIEGIVLAAGQSSRAGFFKPAHLHQGQPLLLHAVDSLAPWCDRVVVVSGHRHQEVREMLEPRREVRLTLNRDHEQGMFSSVRAGMGVLSRSVRGVFVMPVDCPWLEPPVATALIDTFNLHDRIRAVVPEHEGCGGHPVLLPAACREMVARAAADTTLRDIVRRFDPVRVPVEQASVLCDLDTPDDFQALTQAKGNGP
jgi:molybdenum cofactor cytidylyltransferase